MSILIKGMPMPPKDGRAHRALIKQNNNEFVLLIEDAKDFEDRHMDVYPLVEVPEPQNDLIDKKMTNGDKIRAMTDEEIIDFLKLTTDCPENPPTDDCGMSCFLCWLKWLKQEATE